MTTEDNLAVVHRWRDGINAGDIDVAVENLAPDFTGYFSGLPEPVRSPEGFKQMWLGFVHSAFPDQHITVELELASGDRVAVQTSWTATHQGEFMGVPPTGRSVVVPGTGIMRIADGKIAEDWYNFDQLRLLMQLGVIPSQ
jgi:steroid delta-isomerase-like uncharacterized protein